MFFIDTTKNLPHNTPTVNKQIMEKYFKYFKYFVFETFLYDTYVVV